MSSPSGCAKLPCYNNRGEPVYKLQSRSKRTLLCNETRLRRYEIANESVAKRRSMIRGVGRQFSLMVAFSQKRFSGDKIPLVSDSSKLVLFTFRKRVAILYTGS